ncbi:DUF3955 domain-containing protein [Tateyamaria sp. Alg231-49]|uniref:DUF3955 domain-containing protein n=1 Tax=Tateyamaria sp. Alg231-49 TaxID=1922219 RepID=UPI000D55A973|nr:DUF3955 domain-containing protein [Tateyamaria sp. Alg231-49]
MRNKLGILGLVCLVLAGFSWLTETLFYGDVDAEGVLQDSFFLPLTLIFAVLGVALVVISIILDRRR